MQMLYALLVLIQVSHAVSRRFYTNPNANPFGDFALGSGFDMTRYEPTGNHVFSEGADGITYDIMPITNSQTRCALVTSAKELTDKLYVYGEISVTYKMITGSGFVSFDQKEEKMRRKSYYSCTIDRTLFTVSVNPPEITEEMTPEDKMQYLPASLVQQSDGDKLRERIGDYHVQSITYGRRYQTEVELTYTNEDTYQKIAGEIKAKIGVGALSVSAKVKVDLESQNKEEDFSMVIASEAFGFLEKEPLFLPSTTDEEGNSVEQQLEAMLTTNLEAFNQADQDSDLKAVTGLSKTDLFDKLGDAYPLSYTIASNDPYYFNGQLTALQEQMLVEHVDLAYDIKRELRDLQITIEQRAERLFENYHLLSGATELSIRFLEVRQQITDEIMELHAEVNEYLEQTPRELSKKDVYTWARDLRLDGEDKKLEHISLDLYATEVWQLMGMEDAPMEDVNPVGTTCLFNGIQATMNRTLDSEYKLKFAGRVIFGDVTVRHVLFDIDGAVVSLGFIDHTHAEVRPDHCPEEVGEACHELVFVREDCTLLKKGDTVWFEEGRYIIDKIGSDEHIIRGHVVKEKLTNIRIQIVSEDADRGTVVVLTDGDINGVTLRGFHSSYDLTQDLAFRLMYSHGYVCDSGGFSASEAKMVCTHLGYANLRNYETGQKIPTSNAWDRPFVTLWDLHCDKFAMELSECTYKTGELGPEDWDKCGSTNGIFILCSDEQLKEDDVKINIETTNAEGCVLQNWQGKKEPSEVCSGGSADQLDAIANVQIQGDVCLVMYQFGEVQCVIRGENEERYDMTEESVRRSWCYDSFDSDMFPDELELVTQYPKGKGCLDMEANLAELEYIDVKTCAEGEELGLCAENYTINKEQSSEEETIGVSEEDFRRDMETFRDLCVKTCNICPEVVNEQYYTINVIAEESSVLLHNYKDPIPVRVTLLVDNLEIDTRIFGGAEIHSFGDHTCGSKIELIFEPEDLYDHGNVVCEARGVRGIRMENNVGFVSGEVDVTFSCRFPPSASPSRPPSVNPSTTPSRSPSVSPTTNTPSLSPTTSEPTTCPTYLPTSYPTNEPTLLPTMSPTAEPTDPNRGLVERKWTNFYDHNAAADFDWFNTATQIGSDVVVQSISKRHEGTDYSYSWSGYFCPTEMGTYIFETKSDDASHVLIETETIVDNGGNHNAISAEGSYLVTSTACKPISIYYGQDNGPASMSFRFKTPSSSDWETDLSEIFLLTLEVLQDVAEDPTSILGLCQGDCDNDDQCEGDLKCFQREEGTPIPGCSGSANGAWDYCYIASGSVELSGGNDDGATNLQVCTGECDTDRQCAEGLECFHRDSFETIPGCTGTGNEGWDYCYDPQWTGMRM